jgi:hypothetical protein
MRPALLAAMSLAILVLYALPYSAILDGGLGLNADQLIDQSNGNYIIDTGIPENPQVSRKQWSEESGVDFSKIGNSSGGGTNPQESRSYVKTSSNSQSNSTETSEASFSLMGASSSMSAESLAGNWSFRLKDSKNRILALRLFASEDSIFGSGTMNDGGDTVKASASGLMKAGNLSLDVTTTGSVSLYRLDMAVNDTMSFGEYRAFSQDSDPWTGIVQGIRRE